MKQTAAQSPRRQQLDRVLELFAAQLDPRQALEVAWVYPEFAPGMCYETGTYLRRGVNGLARDGTPLWSRPAGDLDGYQPGDVVHWAGRPYRCLASNCLTCPEADPVGWTGL